MFDLPPELPPDLLAQIREASERAESMAIPDIPQVVISEASLPKPGELVTCSAGFGHQNGRAVCKLADGVWAVLIQDREYVAHETWAAWEAIADAQAKQTAHRSAGDRSTKS